MSRFFQYLAVAYSAIENPPYDDQGIPWIPISSSECFLEAVFPKDSLGFSTLRASKSTSTLLEGRGNHNGSITLSVTGSGLWQLCLGILAAEGCDILHLIGALSMVQIPWFRMAFKPILERWCKIILHFATTSTVSSISIDRWLIDGCLMKATYFCWRDVPPGHGHENPVSPRGFQSHGMITGDFLGPQGVPQFNARDRDGGCFFHGKIPSRNGWWLLG